MRKKIFALILAIVLVISSLPLSAFAEGIIENSSAIEETTTTETNSNDESVLEAQLDENSLSQNEDIVDNTIDSNAIDGISVNINDTFDHGATVIKYKEGGEYEFIKYFPYVEYAWASANGITEARVEMILWQDWEIRNALNFSARLEDPNLTPAFILNLNEHSITRSNTYIAVRNGEVLKFDTNTSGEYIIKNGAIKGGNSIGNGAGALVQGNSKTKITFEKVDIIDNDANGYGGGIFYGKENSKLIIKDCNLSRNHAKNNGGGIFVEDRTLACDLTLSGKVEIYNNYNDTDYNNLVIAKSNNNLIQVSSLENGSNIDTSFSDNSATGVFTTSIAGDEATVNKIKGYFDSDVPSKVIGKSGNQLTIETGSTKGAASIILNNDPTTETFYPTADEAWNLANNQYRGSNVTMKLYQNWKRNERLIFESRQEENPFTLDLNGFSLYRYTIIYSRTILRGEVIRIVNSGDFTIKNGTISGGYNAENGGGIIIGGNQNTKVTLSGLKIVKNRSSRLGGGILFNLGVQGENATLKIHDCEIRGNKAGTGGGIYVSSKYNHNPIILSGNVVIDGNTAGNNATNNLTFEKESKESSYDYIDATLLTPDQSNNDLYAPNTIKLGVGFSTRRTGTFTTDFANEADAEKIKDAGYFYCDDNSQRIETEGRKLKIYSLPKATLSVNGGPEINYDTAEEAWTDAYGKYKESKVSMKLLDNWGRNTSLSFLPRNDAATLELNLNGFSISRTNGTTVYGGEVFTMAGSGNFIVKNGTIKGGNNTAAGGGAWIGGNESANITLKDLTITGNKANNGGGIWCGGNKNLTIDHCTISENSATYNGAGIYFGDGTSKLKIDSLSGETIITKNTAQNSGGGVFLGNQNSQGSVEFSAQIRIIDNKLTNGSNSNVVLQNKNPNFITAKGLTGSSNIGISFDNGGQGIFTTKFVNSASNYVQYFFASNPDQAVYVDAATNTLRVGISESNARAKLQINGGDPIYYLAPDTAWNDANSKYVNDNVLMTLLNADWNGNNDGYLGSGSGFKNGALEPVTKPNGKQIILDLNGKTINRNLGERYIKNGDIISMDNKVIMTVKNGKLTGGRNTNCGGCIDIGGTDRSKTRDTCLTVENVEIYDNKSRDTGGAIVKYSNSYSRINIVGTGGNSTWIHDNWAYEGGGAMYVYWNGILGTGEAQPIYMSGKVIIDGNSQGGGLKLHSPNVYFAVSTTMLIPDLTDGSHVDVDAILTPRAPDFWNRDAMIVGPFRSSEQIDHLRNQMRYMTTSMSKHWLEIRRSQFKGRGDGLMVCGKLFGSSNEDNTTLIWEQNYKSMKDMERIDNPTDGDYQYFNDQEISVDVENDTTELTDPASSDQDQDVLSNDNQITTESQNANTGIISSNANALLMIDLCLLAMILCGLYFWKIKTNKHH